MSTARREGTRGGFTSAFVSAGVVCIASAALAVSATGREPSQDVKPASARTVWDKVYTEEQAKRGQTEYTENCASCHAEDLGGGGNAPSLAGSDFSFQWGEMTVGDLFERIRTLMPPDRPDSLPKETYRDIVAFILQFNKIPAGEKELDSDLQALRQIRITTKPPNGL